MGHDAVVADGQLEFVSSGGQQIIDYTPEEREPVGKVSGPSLEDDSKEISLEGFKNQIVVLNAWSQ